MSDLHSSPPGPFTATQTIHLLGGPEDGVEDFLVPLHCSEFYDTPAPQTPAHLQSHYRYCPYASTRFGTPCFIHSTLPWDFYAH